MDGATSSSAVLNITQLGVLSSAISVATNPADLTTPLPSAAGTFTIDLTLGATATGFSSAVSKGELVGGEGFVSIATATNTITVTYTENTTTEDRTGEITITPVLSSGTPTPIVIPFTQIGVPGIALTLADAVNVDFASGRLLIGVDVFGTGASWSVAATTNPSNFLTFPGTVTAGDGTSAAASKGVDGDVLTIVYGGNNGAEREATLTFEALDADGNSFSTPVTQVLTITQAGSPPLILGGVRQTGITPATAHATALPAAAGSSVEFALTLGGGATGFVAEATQGNFFTITKSLGAGNSITVAPELNTNAESREGEITITTEGGSGDPVSEVVSFRQVGTGVGSVSAVSTPNLEETQYVSVAAGNVSFAISLGGSATGWSAVLDPNPSNFLALGATTGNHGDVLVVSHAENTGGTTERTGRLTLTATGGTGAGTAFFDIEQRRLTGPFLVVEEPTDAELGGISVPAAGGNFETRVILHRGAGDFTATESADFITIGEKGGTGQRRTQVIAFTENTGVARTADVTYTSSGGGAAFALDVRFVQLGAAPTLTAATTSTTATDITAIPAAVSGGTGTITGTITLGGGAEGWSAVVEDEGGLFASVLPLAGDLTATTFVATYSANVGVARTAKIILTSTGRTGTQVTQELDFTQLGAAPLITEITAQNTEDGEFPVDFAAATEKLEAESTGTVSATIELGGGADRVFRW